MNNVFLIGCARSGTSILGECLSKHSKISYLFESQFFDNFDEIKYSEYDEELNKKFLQQNDLFDYENMFERGKIKLEKNPRHSLRIPFMWELFPKAKFIHIVRDGRDTVCSLLPGLSNGYWNHLKPKNWKDFQDKPNYIKASYLWNYVVNKVKTDFDYNGRKNKDYIEIKYEHLLYNPKHEIYRILDFLVISPESDIINFCLNIVNETSYPYHAEKQDRWYIPDHKNRIGRYKENLTEKQYQDVMKIIEPGLKRYGYI